MTLFQYKGTNDDGKTVEGSLDAPSLSAATSALESMNIDVTDLREASRRREEPPAAMPSVPAAQKSFAFEGNDASGSVRRGTIQAENKFQAFSKLHQGQGLQLSMLSPVGVTPQFRDNDLENWQKAKATGSEVVPVAPAQKKSVGFTPTERLDHAPKPIAEHPELGEPAKHRYQPVVGTLRLYAGWLLAWYAVFVAVGYYVTERALPYEIPFVQAFYLSPLIFTFTAAIFLFLALSSLQQKLQLKLIGSTLLLVVGVIIFFSLRIAVV